MLSECSCSKCFAMNALAYIVERKHLELTLTDEAFTDELSAFPTWLATNVKLKWSIWPPVAHDQAFSC